MDSKKCALFGLAKHISHTALYFVQGQPLNTFVTLKLTGFMAPLAVGGSGFLNRFFPYNDLLGDKRQRMQLIDIPTPLIDNFVTSLKRVNRGHVLYEQIFTLRFFYKKILATQIICDARITSYVGCAGAHLPAQCKSFPANPCCWMDAFVVKSNTSLRFWHLINRIQ
ncbi:hypothetical protein CSE16_06165 [Solibacillus sp. R5-41]|nr:hypothetical protein CSE16_06165 [Solibacillus sp. R5-41]